MRYVRLDKRPVAARTLCGAAVVLAAAALSACGGGSGSNGSPITRGGDSASSSAPVDATKTTLRVGLNQEPPTWDFIANDGTAIRQVLGLNVVESLLEQTDDGELVPLLASKWEDGDGGRTYTFTIRDATFQDGTPLTSADVVYSLDAQRNSPHPSLAFKQVRDVEAVDPHTVRVTLKRPSQSFLAGMATAAGLIIKKGSAGTLKKGAIGTGPFVFTGYRQGVGLTLRRYDNYWGKKPVLKTVEIRFVTDVSSLFSQFKAGQLDMIEPPPGQAQTDTLKSDPRFKVVNVKAASKTYIALNGKVPAFQDPRVRQAIAMAVDRQALIDTSLNGDGTPICVIAGPGETGFTKDCPYPHDPTGAKALLAEAGVKNLTVELKMVREWGSDTPDLIRSFLQPIGINVKYVQRDWPKYSEEILTPNPDFQMTYLAGPQQVDAWRCPKGWFLETCDPQVDRLLDQADASSSPEEYANLRKQALLLFAKDAWLIPYDVWSLTLATKKELAGVRTTTIPMDELDLRDVHWTKGNG